MNEIIDALVFPVVLCLVAVIGWAAWRVATLCAAKTLTEKELAHNARLARLGDGIARIAGEVFQRLAEAPPGADMALIKSTVIRLGVSTARARFSNTLPAIGGASDAVLAGMINGEYGKLLAASGAQIAVPPAPPILVPAASDDGKVIHLGPGGALVMALLTAGLAMLSACSPAPDGGLLSAAVGQLFCAIHTAGGEIVARVVETVNDAVPGEGGPFPAVMTADHSPAWLSAACAAAGRRYGTGPGVPAPPPPHPDVAPFVAVTLTAG